MPSIDLHAHILPGVDDGPETLEGALDMARTAVAAGTAALAATPHINSRRYIEPEAIPAAVDALTGHLEAAGIPLRLHTGGEVALPRVHDLTPEQLRGLALGGGSCVLLECPFSASAVDFEPTIRRVLGRGLRVLLGHPERSAAFQREPARVRQLVADGAFVQVTAGSLAGAFGSRVRQFTLQLLRDGLVHVIASDSHDARLRPPGLLDALAAAEADVPGLSARATWLSETVPAALLADAPVPEPAPLPAEPRAAWRRMLARAAS